MYLLVGAIEPLIFVLCLYFAAKAADTLSDAIWGFKNIDSDCCKRFSRGNKYDCMEDDVDETETEY